MILMEKKLQCLEEKVAQCHFVHRISYVYCPEIKPRPPLWEMSNQLTVLWHILGKKWNEKSSCNILQCKCTVKNGIGILYSASWLKPFITMLFYNKICFLNILFLTPAVVYFYSFVRCGTLMASCHCLHLSFSITFAFGTERWASICKHCV